MKEAIPSAVQTNATYQRPSLPREIWISISPQGPFAWMQMAQLSWMILVQHLPGDLGEQAMYLTSIGALFFGSEAKLIIQGTNAIRRLNQYCRSPLKKFAVEQISCIVRSCREKNLEAEMVKGGWLPRLEPAKWPARDFL